MNGTADTECTSVGTWSTNIPRCLGKKKLQSLYHNLLITKQQRSSSFKGLDGLMLLLYPVQLFNIPPFACSPPARRCPNLNSPTHGSLACSDPHGVFSFGSQCNSTCEEGFFLNGTAVTECTPVGIWSTEIPNCPGNVRFIHLFVSQSTHWKYLDCKLL